MARQQARRRAARQPLTPALLAWVHDHVQARLAGRILVSDMAAVVGLSPNRFAQAYTACTGRSPYQFVLAARLQRAQGLLREGRLPLAQVAVDCGFASQQHLTHAMRRHLGVTPGRCRQAQATHTSTAA